VVRLACRITHQCGPWPKTLETPIISLENLSMNLLESVVICIPLADRLDIDLELEHKNFGDYAHAVTNKSYDFPSLKRARRTFLSHIISDTIRATGNSRDSGDPEFPSRIPGNL